MEIRFSIIDVFAEQPLAGNQLAVCYEAGDLTTERMQALARETNYSETTFICSSLQPNGGYNVRIFTPKTELPFAGHRTVGTAFALRQAQDANLPEQLILNFGIGQIPVSFVSDGSLSPLAWMTQKDPRFEETLSSGLIGLRNLRPRSRRLWAKATRSEDHRPFG